MLKLERKDSGLGISIGIRTKEKWLNQSLITGITIALLLHGSAFFLFNIQPFRVHYSRSPQLPAFVETDLTAVDESQDPHIYAQLEEEKKRRRDPLMPAPSSPKLPAVALPAYTAPLASNSRLMAGVEQFASLEKEVLTFKDVEQELFLSPIVITLSGGLAGRELNWISPAPVHFSDTFPSIHYLAEIQVDEENGSIFWSAPLLIEGERGLLDQIEKLMEDLNLVPLKKQMISRGTIDITLVEK